MREGPIAGVKGYAPPGSGTNFTAFINADIAGGYTPALRQDFVGAGAYDPFDFMPDLNGHLQFH